MRRSSWLLVLGTALLVACGLAASPASSDRELGSVFDQEYGSPSEQEPASPLEQEPDSIDVPAPSADASRAVARAVVESHRAW